ncbi:MAG: hypothetical protein RL215_678, partial [Planctomycetota bacterium]
MSLFQWMRKIQALSRSSRSRRPFNRPINNRTTRAIPAETLEERTLLTACLFVDWGDNFPGGILSTTLGGLRDVYDDPGSGANDILGPELTDLSGFNATTPLNIVSQTFTTADREAMMENVVRAYLPLDIQVINLTSTPQPAPGGRSVSAASSMSDVIATLQAGGTGYRDAYVFVARFVAAPGTPFEVVYGPDGGGTSPVNGLDTSDLSAASNVHDDVAVVFTDSSFGYNFNTMNNIAHEAGHNFGLRHSLTKSSGNPATDLLHLSEVTSYLNTNSTTSSIAFSRYPMIRGDGNSPGGFLVDYDDLEARNGTSTPWDQLAADPNVGANPDYSFVSGTGAHDVIRISRAGANALVSVTAYADSLRTDPIDVPGPAAFSWSYTIPLTKPILVFAGASEDLIQIDGDLGVDVEIDGMLGTDQLLVDTLGALAATWTPNPTAPFGTDRTSESSLSRVPNYGGSLTWGSTNAILRNFEPSSNLRVLNSSQIIVNGSTADDALQVSKAGIDTLINGTIDGTATIPLLALYPDLITFNALAGSDSLTIDHSSGFVNHSINYYGDLPHNSGEPGGDTLRVLGTPAGGLGPFSRETYLVGATEDAGVWIFDPDGNTGPGAGGMANGDEMRVEFSGLEPVDSDTAAAFFDVVWNNNFSDTIRIENGGPLPGGTSLRVVDLSSTFETFRFANKNVVRLHLNGGADTTVLNYSVPADLLSVLEVFGHGDPIVAGVIPEDNAVDQFAAIANTAGVVTGLYGQGGNDRLNNFLAVTPAGSSSLASINGSITFSGGDNTDEILLTNATSPAVGIVTLNSSALSGAAPAPITWSTVESFVYGGTQFSDTIDVLSTAPGTRYTIYTNDGADDVVTIGNTRAAFQAPAYIGSLLPILGEILVAHDHAPNPGPDANDTLNVDASGDAALTGPAAMISSVGFVGTPLDGFVDSALTTRLSGFASVNIDYQHGANTFGDPGDRLEFLNVRTSRGADFIRVVTTTASVATTLDSRQGNDVLSIIADSLSAANTFQGFDGNDDFTLSIATHIGNLGFVSPTTLRIEGNSNPATDSANRDRLNIIDANSNFARNLTYDYLDGQGDLDILAGSFNDGLFGPEDGGLLPLEVRTMETLRFDSTGTANDLVSVLGTSADDDLTVALTPSVTTAAVAASSAFVFLGGNPYITSPGAVSPPDSLAGNLPGRSGGGLGVDLLINGMSNSAGIRIDGSGSSAIGNRAIIQTLSEAPLIDPVSLAAGLDPFNLGLGAGIITPGAGVGNAFDAVSFNAAPVSDADLGLFNSAPDQIAARNVAFGPLLPVNLVASSFTNGNAPVVRPGLILNAGDEASARNSGIADNLFVNLHSAFSIAINGNLPALGALATDGFHAGDQLSIASAESFSVWSDKTSLPHVTVAAGNSPYTALISSIERTRLYPGNGTLNLVGDQNNPSVDQLDAFRVLGVDIDPAGSADAGVQELAVQINGSAPILVDGVQRLNVYGFDLNGQNLNSPNPLAPDNPVGSADANIDTLDITPFADNAGGLAANAPRGWGVQTIFNEGSPASADGEPADLLVVHTSIGPSTGLNVFGRGIASDQISLHPAGPDNGEVRINNAADGSAIAVIAWIGNTDIIVLDDDGAVSDTDTLALFGTDPATPQVSGNDTFEVDFNAAGTVTNPMVSVRDAESGQILYRLRSLQLPNSPAAPLRSIAFNLLGGNDSMTIISNAIQTSNGDTGPHVTINGGSDDDSLAVQYAFSENLPPGHITWDGGTGNDSLSFIEPTRFPESARSALSVTYWPGPIPGNGRVEHEFNAASGIVDFSNLEPVFDFLAAPSVTVNAGDNSNQISYYTDYGVGALGPVINSGLYLFDGLYLNVPLTGGSGSGARADVLITGGGVVAVNLVNDGSGYAIGDVLSAPTASLGGGSGGFLIQVVSHSGTVAVDNQEVLVFANKNTLVLNAQAGSDSISINNPITPAGLSLISVVGGDPAGSDSLLVHGRAGIFDNLAVTPFATGSGVFTAATPGLVPVLYLGTEHLHVVDQASDREQLNFNGTQAADTFTWSPGVTADAGSLTGQAIGGPDFAFVPVTWSGITGAIVAATSVRDTLVLDGTSGDDLFNLYALSTPASFPVTYPGIQLTTGAITHPPVFSGNVVSLDQVLIRGLAGNDTFRLNFNPLSTAGQLTPIFIEGGESGQFSDSLEFLPSLNAVTILDLAASTIFSTGANPINFSGLEALSITGSDASAESILVNNLGAASGLLSVTLNTADTFGADDADTIDVSLGSGPDTLDYTPLSPSSALLQRREGGTQIRVLNLNAQIGDLTVAGGGSIDTLNVNAPSSHDLVDILRSGNSASVTVVAAGNSGAGTVWVPVDFTLLSGPATFDNLSVSGNAGDDLLRVDNSGGLITLNSGMNYNGGSGRDALLLLGSTAVTTADYSVGPNPGDGRVVHSLAGPPAQSQSVTFSGLEPVIDLVSAGTLSINATDADNAISYGVGPNSGVVSLLNPAGLATSNVAIDGFEPYEFANKNLLIIRALGGNDNISLSQPAAPASLVGITVDGGLPAAGSDAVLISGTTAAEAFRFAVLSNDAALITGAGPIPVTVVMTEHVSIAGQGGADTLTWVSPAGPDVIRFSPAGNDSSGSITASRGTGGMLLPMSFSNIAAVGPAANLFVSDVSGNPVDKLTILGTEGSDVAQVTSGGIVTISSLQNALLAPITAAGGVLQLTLEMLAGDDRVFVPGSHPFFPLTVDAGEPGGSDTLNIAGSGGGLTVALIPQTVTEGGLSPTVFVGIEQLNLDAVSGWIGLITTSDRDVTDYYPEGPNSGTLTNNQNSPRINFINCGTLFVDQLGGSDTLEIHGTSLSENIAINLPARFLAIPGLEVLNFNANTEAVRAHGQAGNDSFFVTPDPFIPAYIDGADPIGITPGDSLTILAGGGGVVFEPGPESDEGAFIVGLNQRVSFDHIEALTVSGPGGAWVAGTGADDDITVIARDASTHGLADGFRDFTVQVNAGPQVLWIDAPILFLNAGAGDDDVVMRVPAPNNAVWNVATFISGGAPAAGPYSDGDRFELETPQNQPDTILYTAAAADAGLLIINEFGTGIFNPIVDSPIQLGGPFTAPPLPGLPPLDPGGFETLVYDGEAGNDVVIVFGDAGGRLVSDTFTHTPGAEPDDGTVLINSLLAIQYTDLGVGGVIGVDGLTGADTLVADGTQANETFTVAAVSGYLSHTLASGAARVLLAHVALEQLIINGYAGSDTFQLPGNTPIPVTVNGGTPDAGSDSILFTASGNTIVDLGLATIDDDGVNPPADVSYSDIEQILLTGAGFGLTVTGTAVDDVLVYTPQGPSSGQIQANSSPPVVRFSSVSAFAVSGASGTADSLVVQGTSNHDVITVDSPARTVAVTNAVGTLLQPVVLNTDVEIVRVESGLGNDTVVVVPALPFGPSTPAPQSLPTNLLIDVNGGPPGASDALVIAGSIVGTTLPASDFVVHNRSRTPDSGRIRVFRNIQGSNIIPLPDISYSDVEIVSPLVAVNPNPAIGPQLLQQGPDLYEQNESWQNAAYLGSAAVINASNLAIFPDTNEHPFVPNDTDFYRVVAKETGTLDFQVYFNTYNGLLPGGGDLDIRVLDSDGTVIAGSGSPALNATFGVSNAANPTVVPPLAAGNNPDERLRIPVIAGQTYYLQVFNPSATRFNTNGYHLAITNTPAPVPAQIELNDALVNGAIVAAGVPVGAETAFTVPAGLLNPTPNFYLGKTIHFLTGANAGLSLRITSQVAPATLRVATAGLRNNGAAADAFRIESSDTGRSRFDNTTRDNTPLILFRLDDNLLQQDLPGNPVGGPTPDQPTRIPWNNSFSTIAGPSVAAAPATDPALYVAGSVPGLTAGYRVAVYEEGTTTTPAGPGPNGLWGYATMIAPGVYQFNFGNTATNNLFGPASLTNGSHFLTARVEIIDPAAAPGIANVQARGLRSTPLEIIVDAEAPTAAFGDLVSIVDGLHPGSDSSVPGIASTISDRVTSDTTPAFWGTAEANAIVRAYLDVDASGTITGPDILLGQAVAIPGDGSDQAPFGQWNLTSTIDLNSPLVLAALAAQRDGLRRILISAEDTAGNIAMPAGVAAPQLSLNIFIDTQGPQLIDPDTVGPLQTIQIANPSPLGSANPINSYNLFAVKPANAAQGPTPLVSGLTIHVRDLPSRVLPFLYEAIQSPPLAGTIIPPLDSVSPLAGAPAIAALAPIPVPAGASALNPADFSVIGDANGPIPILSAYFVPIAASTTAASPALGYIVLTFHSTTAGDFLPDDRFTLTLRDTLVDPANNRLDGENQGLSLPAGNLFTPSGDGKPGGSFVARFTV